MLIVRYWSYGSITDKKVNAENSIQVYNEVKMKFKKADLIFIDNDVEYCLL